MPKFLIEREIPGAGDFTSDELQAISARSCAVLTEMPSVQWLEAFVTSDKIYCLLIAPDEAAVRDHAERTGFPADAVAEVRTVIDPTTADHAGSQTSA